MVERLNRTVKGAIQTAKLCKQPIAGYVRKFLAEYRVTRHPATGVTPFRAMRGREARTPMDVLPVPGKGGARALDNSVRKRVESYQAKYKARFDSRAGAEPTWVEGDWVRVRHPRTGRISGRPPVQIEVRTGPVSYRLCDGQRVHARRLVSAKPPCDGVSRESVSTDLDPAPDPILPLLHPEAPVRAAVEAPVVGLAGAGVEVARQAGEAVGERVRVEPAVVEAGAAGHVEGVREEEVGRESPVRPPRKSGRVVKPPDRYSP